MKADGALPGDEDAGVADLVRLRIRADVAGGNDDEDAGARRRFDSLHQRVGCGRFEHRVAERQVDDVDAERFLVRGRELDGRDHVARRAGAEVVSTRRPMRRAFGATPAYWPPDSAPLPATRPATCVPWP